MSSTKNRRRKRGFTLVEMMMSVALGVLVIGAVMTIMVMAAQLYHKNGMIADAANSTRLIQEHLNLDFSRAISQYGSSQSIQILPVLNDQGPAVAGDPVTRFGILSYRISLGSPATVAADTQQTATSITLNCDADMLVPQPGDFLIYDGLNLGYMDTTVTPNLLVAGIPILTVTDNRPGADVNHPTGPGTVTITSFKTNALYTPPASPLPGGDPNSIIAYNRNQTDPTALGLVLSGTTGKAAVVSLQRNCWYQTVQRLDNPALAELRWYGYGAGNVTAGGSGAGYDVLTSSLDATSRYIFGRIPSGTLPSTPVDVAYTWQVNFKTPEAVSILSQILPASVVSYIQPGQVAFYQTNHVEGVIMPGSGNPLTSDGGLGKPHTTSTTSSTSSTTTSSSTTTISTTSSSTTSISTTTSSTSTTSRSTTTSMVTTISSISTTTSASSTTTSKSTTTTSASTTTISSTTTSKSTTTTSSTSTTSKSTTTTSSTSTTSKSTTTTSSTSTTSKSTTTTSSTSTTSKSTTTTSASTTTTSKSTTTSSTSTTTSSTTSASTTTTSASTTTTSASTTTTSASTTTTSASTTTSSSTTSTTTSKSTTTTSIRGG